MCEADNILEKLCSGCRAAFYGGWPDFNVEELKKKWKGYGYCIRCNLKLDLNRLGRPKVWWVCPVCRAYTDGSYPVEHLDSCDYCEKRFEKLNNA